MPNIDFDQVVSPEAKRAAFRTAALARIDGEHASFIRMLTGNATIEERDTWKTKEEAARAFLAETATAGQQEMLALEAEGRGERVGALAATIVDKADGFVTLIGLASKLRAQARVAVKEATDDTVPIENVEAAIDAVFVDLSGQVAAAVDQAVANYEVSTDAIAPAP